MVKQAFVFVVLGRAAAMAVLVRLLKAPMLRAIQASVPSVRHSQLLKVK